MSTDEPFIPPQKKPNVLWWIGGGFFVLVLVFFLQLFGPNPPIVVSPQTTHITSPLGANGLPDYERFVLERAREGVTPENNAAVLIWQALWPGELDAKDYAAIMTELGLEKVPTPGESLDSFYSQANRAAIQEWLKELTGPAVDAEVSDPEVFQQAVVQATDKLIDEVLNRPWTSGECPPLAKWVVANKKPIDLLVEASQRPRCYIPSPSLVNRQKESLVEILLPGVQSSREAGRVLAARAMWHAGEGRVDEAWRDLLAAHRLGRLVAQGPTLIEQLVGMAIDGIAREGTLALLSHSRPSVEQAQQIHRDLAALPNLNSVAESLDSMERLMFVDAVIQFSKGGSGDQLELWGVGQQAAFINRLSVNWNVVLQKGNEFYDRYAAAARLPTRVAREQAFGKIQTDLRQLEQEIHDPAALAAGVISPGRRSEIVAAIMVNLFLPAVEAATNAQDRANAQMDLLRLAAALAVYRAEHGVYPEKLDDLAPAVVDKLPVDLYNAQKFIYKRAGVGYLLYTAGENGLDDGGSNKMYRTLRGQPVDQLDDGQGEAMETQIPEGADDIPILVPTPKWEPPKLPGSSGP